MKATRSPLPFALALLFACNEAPPAARGTASPPAQPAAPAPEQAPQPAPAPAKPEAPKVPNYGMGHQARWGETAGLTYLEVVQGEADFDDELPMIVAIHGLGDRPENFYGLLQQLGVKARIILPRALDAHGDGWSWFPYRARSPDVQLLSESIDKAATVIVGALRELDEKHPRPDHARIIMTGFSQGGMLSFTTATKAPELFDYVLPIGGWLPGPLVPEAKAADLPHSPEFVALHGDADPAVKIGPTREGVAALQEKGYSVQLHEYPGVKHAIPPEMRAELYQLLGQAIAGQSILKPEAGK